MLFLGGLTDPGQYALSKSGPGTERGIGSCSIAGQGGVLLPLRQWGQPVPVQKRGRWGTERESPYELGKEGAS